MVVPAFVRGAAKTFVGGIFPCFVLTRYTLVKHNRKRGAKWEARNLSEFHLTPSHGRESVSLR